MPLIKCPDCGKKISDQAAICLRCGRPMKPGAWSGVQFFGGDAAWPEASSGTEKIAVVRRRTWPIWLAAALTAVAAATAALWQLWPGANAPPASPAIGAKFVKVPAGRFQMGSPPDEPGRADVETRHLVTISKAFLLQTTPVTQGQWRRVMGSNPAFFKSCGDDCPVESVSWYDAIEFCNRLSDKEGLSRCYQGAGNDIQWDRKCRGYRLPTEAEWEYAARAGSATALYSGPLTIRGENNGPELDQIAWYGGNSQASYPGGVDCSGWKDKQYPSASCGIHPAAGKRGNAWGLYDMLGNVWQWVWDWEGDFPAGSVADPAGPAVGSQRVDRGGCWDCYARFCRSANRDFSIPGSRYYSLGFRLARSLP